MTACEKQAVFYLLCDLFYIKFCSNEEYLEITEKILQRYISFDKPSHDKFVEFILSISKTPNQQKTFFSYILLFKCSQSIDQKFEQFCQNHHIVPL